MVLRAKGVDAGVAQGTPPHVAGLQRLIIAAVAAANAGETTYRQDDRDGTSVVLIKDAAGGYSIGIGVVLHEVGRCQRLRASLAHLGAEGMTTEEVLIVARLPLEEV